MSGDAEPYAAAVQQRIVRAREQRDALSAAIEETRLARSLTFSDDEHDPDGSLASLDQARDVALLRQVEQTLAALAATQARISDGSWNRCAECGGDIGLPRLLARPETRQCLGCAAVTRRRRR